MRESKQSPEKHPHRFWDWLVAPLQSPALTIDDQRERFRRLEPFLLLFLLTQGSILLLADQYPRYLIGLMVVMVLIFLWSINRYQTTWTSFVRMIITVSVSCTIIIIAKDTSASWNVWYYLTVVFYTLWLAPPYHRLSVLIVPLAFAFTNTLVPTGTFPSIMMRVLLMFGLGMIIWMVRIAVIQTIVERTKLVQALQKARDDYARQLKDRTTELENEIHERQNAEAKLAEERQLLQTIIDSIPSRLFVKDRQSRFTLVNQWSLERLGFKHNPKGYIGKTDFDFYPQFADWTYETEQKLMESGEPIIDHEETTIDEHGIARHYLINKVPMYDPQTKDIIGLIGITTEVTQMKQAQNALRESQQSLREFQSQLKILNQVAVELTNVETFDELAYHAIRHAIHSLGFERMSCWFIDTANPSQMRGSYRVSESGEITSVKNAIMQMTEDHPAYDVVTGAKRSFAWLDSPIYDMNFNVVGHGDKAVTTLFDGNKIIGCLFIDNLLQQKPLNDSQIELLNLYGATLGALFNRKRAEGALKASEEEALHFQQLLKKLNEITVKLETSTSFETLCQQVIQLGRAELGFDRLGIWFALDDQPGMRRGGWGTDIHGNLRDERMMTLPLSPMEEALKAEGDLLARVDSDLYDFDFTIVGQGWNLVGLLWDGQKRLGWLYADNYFTKSPLTPNRYELFRLFTATVSLLCVRRRAEDNLRKSEIRFRAITEASSDIIAIVNSHGAVTYISPALKTFIGTDPEAIIGRNIDRLIHRDDVPIAKAIIQQCVQNPGLNTRMDEFRVRHIDGEWIHMEAIVISLVNDPVVNGIVVSCRDLTQRLIAEERKRAIDQERERGNVLRQFINDISHDFRTPLSTIATAAYLIKQTHKTQNIEGRLEVIDQQIMRLEKLLNNLNTITRLDEVSQIHMQKMDVNHILNAIHIDKQSAIAAKKLSFQLDLQHNLPEITGNIRLINDAFTQIIDNAIHYCREEDSIIIQTYADQNRLVVQIADTGIGIAQEDLPHVFDRMYRADKARNTLTGGSGLGLAITRRIIDLHQGTINITSQLDEGTLIDIRLPSI